MELSPVLSFLNRIAPLELAEAWDNVGLLWGDHQAEVQRVMTCLTVTPASAQEAIDQRVDLIVTHHPVLFRPAQKITTESMEGGMLWRLARAGVSIYSPHTAFDSSVRGINERWAKAFDCAVVGPLVPRAVVGPLVPQAPESELGAGRHGLLPGSISLAEFTGLVKQQLKLTTIGVVGNREERIRRVGFACGSGGSLIRPAIEAGCEVLLTGEASFHDCLLAEANGLALLLVGHFASERFAVEQLATDLAAEFPELEIFASREERDPVNRQ